MNLYTQKGNFLQCFRGCAPANPMLHACIQKTLKLFSPQGWVSQLVFSICWNSREVDSNAGEGVDLVGGQEQAGRERDFLLPCLFYKLGAESVAQIKDRSSHLKRSVLKVCLFHLQDPD